MFEYLKEKIREIGNNATVRQLLGIVTIFTPILLLHYYFSLPVISYGFSGISSAFASIYNTLGSIFSSIASFYQTYLSFNIEIMPILYAIGSLAALHRVYTFRDKIAEKAKAMIRFFDESEQAILIFPALGMIAGLAFVHSKIGLGFFPALLGIPLPIMPVVIWLTLGHFLASGAFSFYMEEISTIQLGLLLGNALALPIYMYFSSIAVTPMFFVLLFCGLAAGGILAYSLIKGIEPKEIFAAGPITNYLGRVRDEFLIPVLTKFSNEFDLRFTPFSESNIFIPIIVLSLCAIFLNTAATLFALHALMQIGLTNGRSIHIAKLGGAENRHPLHVTQVIMLMTHAFYLLLTMPLSSGYYVFAVGYSVATILGSFLNPAIALFTFASAATASFMPALISPVFVSLGFSAFTCASLFHLIAHAPDSPAKGDDEEEEDLYFPIFAITMVQIMGAVMSIFAGPAPILISKGVTALILGYTLLAYEHDEITSMGIKILLLTYLPYVPSLGLIPLPNVLPTFITTGVSGFLSLVLPIHHITPFIPSFITNLVPHFMNLLPIIQFSAFLVANAYFVATESREIDMSEFSPTPVTKTTAQVGSDHLVGGVRRRRSPARELPRDTERPWRRPAPIALNNPDDGDDASRQTFRERLAARRRQSVPIPGIDGGDRKDHRPKAF